MELVRFKAGDRLCKKSETVNYVGFLLFGKVRRDTYNQNNASSYAPNASSTSAASTITTSTSISASAYAPVSGSVQVGAGALIGEEYVFQGGRRTDVYTGMRLGQSDKELQRELEREKLALQLEKELAERQKERETDRQRDRRGGRVVRSSSQADEIRDRLTAEREQLQRAKKRVRGGQHTTTHKETNTENKEGPPESVCVCDGILGIITFEQLDVAATGKASGNKNPLLSPLFPLFFYHLLLSLISCQWTQATQNLFVS